MNITIVVAGQSEVAKALAAFPGKAHRACAVALNKAGKLVKEAEVEEMKAAFDNPTRFTLNSLKPPLQRRTISRPPSGSRSLRAWARITSCPRWKANRAN